MDLLKNKKAFWTKSLLGQRFDSFNGVMASKENHYTISYCALLVKKIDVPF